MSRHVAIHRHFGAGTGDGGDVRHAITPHEWHSAFKELYGPEAGLDAVRAQGQPQGEIADLNAPATLDEVKAAFTRLKRNKAAGTDGIRAEFLLDAVDVLLQPLAQVFTHMLMNGVPSDWCKGTIFKAGDVNDLGNYRGITVTLVLSKLFAMILEARMSSWAEQCDIRAAGQAGFRKDHRTTDNVFIIHTLVAQARRSHRKLYCCFVDFKKAFDSVPRHTLWQVLAELGINGNILDSLKSIVSQYVQERTIVLHDTSTVTFSYSTTTVRYKVRDTANNVEISPLTQKNQLSAEGSSPKSSECIPNPKRTLLEVHSSRVHRVCNQYSCLHIYTLSHLAQNEL